MRNGTVYFQPTISQPPVRASVVVGEIESQNLRQRVTDASPSTPARLGALSNHSNTLIPKIQTAHGKWSILRYSRQSPEYPRVCLAEIAQNESLLDSDSCNSRRSFSERETASVGQLVEQGYLSVSKLRSCLFSPLDPDTFRRNTNHHFAGMQKVPEHCNRTENTEQKTEPD
jgi:hypothetical protein